jgi:hypothetical protein
MNIEAMDLDNRAIQNAILHIAELAVAAKKQLDIAIIAKTNMAVNFATYAVYQVHSAIEEFGDSIEDTEEWLAIRNEVEAMLAVAHAGSQNCSAIFRFDQARRATHGEVEAKLTIRSLTRVEQMAKDLAAMLDRVEEMAA